MSSVRRTRDPSVPRETSRQCPRRFRGPSHGFTKRYNVTHLVYFEELTDVHDAIAREKSIKKWSRAKKIALIQSKNPKWNDLARSANI